LVAIGQTHGIPVVNDLGSGVFIPTNDLLGYHEPSVQDSVRAGASLTCFSGDKLLGGVQAGLIVGRADLVKKVKKNPVFRALRVDKVVYSVVEKLLSIYLNGTHQQDIKLWSILSTPVAELRRRAEHLHGAVGAPATITIRDTGALVGGGALPEQTIPSVALAFAAEIKATALMKRFREMTPPVIGRIVDDRLVLDLKAVDESHLDTLAEAIRIALSDSSSG
ncbi:MAG: L-seryl-tRNA(Sec) selenium transferase, partial [candidate division Zixibacteria bacterium]|nr:L-seryl-tRNA(Sec) selenium transferase [candidate division Zixibacteria bacterium]